MKKRLSKSLRKFIRLEKARIRRQVLDLKKQEELINELYQRLLKTELSLMEAKSKKSAKKSVSSFVESRDSGTKMKKR